MTQHTHTHTQRLIDRAVLQRASLRGQQGLCFCSGCCSEGESIDRSGISFLLRRVQQDILLSADIGFVKVAAVGINDDFASTRSRLSRA